MRKDLTTREAAQKLNVSPNRIAQLLRDGTIKGYRLNIGPKARWRIPQAEIDRFRGVEGSDDVQ